MVNMIIDGKQLTVKEDLTILQAARQAGIVIPTLCYLEGLNEIGACRLCVVEVEGMNRLVSSCNTKVQEGMVVATNTAKVRAARKLNTELSAPTVPEAAIVYCRKLPMIWGFWISPIRKM